MANKSNGAILSLDQILEAADIKEETIAVPEWGGSVKVRGFTKKQELEIREQSRIGDEIDRDRLEMLFFIHGMVEPQATPEHMEALSLKSRAAIDRVLAVIIRISGQGEEAKEAAKATFPEGRKPEVPVPAGEGPAQDSGAAQA